MKSLVLALYVEGRSDERFLPIIVQRTVERILMNHSQSDIDVLPPLVLEPPRDTKERAERILVVARQARGYHILIIHADADHPTPEKARHERIQPGFELVRQTKDGVCNHLVAIIPVRMIEAWMLADGQALQKVIGTDLDAESLGIPKQPQQVEAIIQPKQTLVQAIQNGFARRSRRSRQPNLGSLYEPLAQLINLDILQKVPAYQQFIDDLTTTLIALHL